MSRALLSIGVIQVFIMLVSLGRAKILSVLLGPAGLGVVSVLDQTVTTVVTLSALSLPLTAMKFLARSHSESDAAVQRTFTTFFRALAGLAIAAVLIVAAVLAWKPALLGQDLFPYRGYLALAIINVPAAVLQILFVNTLAAVQQPARSASLAFLVGLALATFGVVGALLFGFRGLYAGTAAAGALSTVATLWYFHRRLGFRLTGHSESLFELLRRNREIMVSSLCLFLAMAAYTVTMLSTRYFVFSELGEASTGLLHALLGISLSIGAVVAPMSNLYLIPLVNRRGPNQDKVTATNIFAEKMILLILLGALPIVLFPRFTLVTLFSSKFSPAASVLFCFVLWQCAFQIVYVYLQLLVGLDDLRFFALTTCASYGLTALLFPFLIPRIGLVGSGIALAGGSAAAAVAVVLRLRLKFAVQLQRRIWFRAVAVLGIVASAGLLFAGSPENTLPAVLERVGFAFAALGLLAIGLSRSERELLQKGFARLRVPGVPRRASP